MATQNYSTVASRNLIRAEQEMLEHAENIIVLGAFGLQKEQPLRKTDTVVFRRLNPFNMQSNGVPGITASNFILSEGVTPNANTIAYTDVSVTLQNYGVLFKFSSKSELMYEDNIPQDMSKLTGETMGEVTEMIRYGALKGGTNILYANGSTRAGVNTALSLAKVRSATRTLNANRAKRVTQRLSTGPDFGSAPVEPGFIVFIHTDVESDARNLPGFTKVEEYAQRRPVHPREIGSVESFRIVTSPLLVPFDEAGSATLNGMLGSSNVDVYPVIVIAEEAWGSVALKGMGAVEPTIISSKTKNHANPMGMFGFVGGSLWYAGVRLNENWMVRIECGATSL